VSLLLKALQRASSSRESATRTSTAASARPGPDNARGVPPSTRETMKESPALGRSATAGNRQSNFSDSGATSPRDATVLREDSFSLSEWGRENPVYVFAILALVFLVFYFIYVFVAINYPGAFTRSGSFISPASTGSSQPLARAPAKPQGDNPSLPATPELPPPPMPSIDRPPQATQPPSDATGKLVPPPTQSPVKLEEPPAVPVQPAPASAPVVAAETPLADKPAQPSPPPVRKESRKVVREPEGRGRAVVAAATPSPTRKQAERDERLQVRQTDAGSVTGRQLEDAYGALQSGDHRKAQGLYESVLGRDRRNVDAMLGLAATSWRMGNSEKASAYYYEVLELDPQNAAAQAGLIGMVGRVDPVASETRLKQLLAREPSGLLYAALGNVHAEQNQWPAAQQAYFQAFQMEPSNPDYAFNLAVGLEHLGQQPLAVGYYRRALELARAKGYSGFDVKQVTTRLEKLGARQD